MSNFDDHNRGLKYDLDTLVKRRQVLNLMALLGMSGLLAGCDDVPFFSRSDAEVTNNSTDGSECVAHPRETAGPFPGDGSNRVHGTLANVLDDSGIVRNDMRPNIGGAPETTAPGIRLDLKAKLTNVTDSCRPLKGYVIYLWHCDAAGRYSLYDIPDATYLRAVGETDAQGEVAFTTIVPGCYAGRYPHMHFEVYPSLAQATNYRSRILTSQLVIPATVCRAVYNSDPDYRMSLGNFQDAPLSRDMVFADNTPKQLAAQTLAMVGSPGEGYQGEVTIGLKV